MADRYGKAKSPAPSMVHTCKVRTRIQRSWSAQPVEKCPGCRVESAEGWPQLVESLARG